MATPAPEIPGALTEAEPEPGSEFATSVSGVFMAECAHCGEEIWSGPSWEWEHFSNDETACAA